MPGLLEYLSPWGNQNCYVETILAVPLVSFPVAAPLRLEYAFILEMEERVDPVGTFNVNVPPFPAVPAAGTALWHKFFSSESKTSISAISSFHFDLRTVNKQSSSDSAGQTQVRTKKKGPRPGSRIQWI